MIDLRDPRELETLLGRPSASVLTPIDRALMRDQSVLITGAGGSVGSALAREVAACQPARLVVFEHPSSSCSRSSASWPRAFPRVHAGRRCSAT